ncbi:MAG: hypothetical protein ABS79_02980 [Planctomycetes bacterium SCN 63-9]|nr:MAG: hypothetical protein ABS79_02980 [Planctomycetes bacterium SCN 63-9]
MGTLEVHDPQGRVQFLVLTKEHPVVFGSSPSCDLVLSGEGIRPVEGRIRWKKTRFRVEASPDAEFVLVNGNRMSAAGLSPGDEISIEGCRIFLMRDEDPEDPPPKKSGPKLSDRPHLHTPPRIQEHAEVKLAPATKNVVGNAKGQTHHDPATFDQDDWLEIIEPEPGLDLVGDDEDEAHATSMFPGPPAKPKNKLASKSSGFFKRYILRKKELSEENYAPHREERLLSSPLVWGLFATLAALVLLGIVIYSVLVRTLASRLYNQAVESLDNGDYLNSIRSFDEFLAANPSDARAGKARVLRALANVRQYVTPGGSEWSNALEAGRSMFEDVQSEPEFRDEKAELGELMLRIGEGLADRARLSADRKSLGEAESTIPLHARIVGEPAAALLSRSSLPAKLGEARAAIRKFETRRDSLSAMDQALKDGSAKGVYSARDGLIQQYGEFANDRELVRRMVDANELVRRGVKVSSERRPAESRPRPEPLGAPTTLILRTPNIVVTTSADAESLTVFSLADGFAYGIAGDTGIPRWQRPVGLAASFAPRPVPNDPSCLVVDARYHDLLKLHSATGDLIWRQNLGEAVDDPPLVLGNQVFQALPSGKLLIFELNSGELQATVETGFPLSVTPVADESGRHLYLVARRDCLLILTRDPLGCAAVEYLGHAEGSVPASPSRLGRFLIVPENHTLSDGRWRVFVLDTDGARMKAVQEIPVAGWTWSSPPTANAIVWSTSDRGVIEAFAVGDYGSPRPFRSISRLDGDFKNNGPVYAFARNERELWLASAHAGRYDLDPVRGTITVKYGLGQLGPAAAPIQPIGKLLGFSFQDPGNLGTSVRAVDPDSGTIAWRSILGPRWLIPPHWVRDGSVTKLMTIDLQGRTVEITRKLLEDGGLLDLELPKKGEFSLPLDRFKLLEVAGHQVLAPPIGSQYVWVQDPNPVNSMHWRKVDLPSPLATVPAAWGGGLLIPGADTRIYVIDPQTGRSIVEPFVPVFDREKSSSWLAPAVVDAQSLILADNSGQLRRLTLREGRLGLEVERSLDAKVAAPPTASPGTVIVATADQKVRALAARDLSPIGSWSSKGPITTLPETKEGKFFIPDDLGGVLAIASDGRRLWSIDLESRVVGDPLVMDGAVWFLTLEGILHGRSLETGESLARVGLNILPTSGPMPSIRENELIIPVARGTFQTLRLPKKVERKP